MAPTLAPKRVREAATLAAAWFSQSKKTVFPLGFPAASSKCRQKTQGQKGKKKKENHEGEKNGCRGLRNPQPLPTLLPLLRPERHTTVDFPFPCRLPSAADTSAWISGLSGSRTLREKPAKQDQTLGGGRGLNKSGSWWPTGGVTRFPFCFMFCIQHI